MNFVYNTNPHHTEQGVDLDKSIEIRFMMDMNSKLITSKQHILLNITEGRIEQTIGTYANRTLTVVPVSEAGLRPNCHYQLQIVGGEDGVRNIMGMVMAQTYELEFYTKDVKGIKPPIILTPTDLTSLQGTVTPFKLKPSEHAVSYEVQVSRSNTFLNLVWPDDNQLIDAESSLEFTPLIEYQSGAYYARARAIDKDQVRSSWSATTRFYYDGEPIVILPEEEEVPEETPTETPQEVVGQVVLKTTSKLHSEPGQLLALQDIFSNALESNVVPLKAEGAKPRDKSVNNNLERFNDNRVGKNRKQIIITFNSPIDPQSVTEDSCYVLMERN